MATVRSVFALLSLLGKGRQLEFYDRLMFAVESRFFPNEVAEPAGLEISEWQQALAQLCQLLNGESGELLREQPLVDIEAELGVSEQRMRSQYAFLDALSADRTMARCCYLVCRMLRPSIVVETGVAYGMASAYILQALEANGNGVLHSIDLPLSTEYETIGLLVPERLRGRWSLHYGASRRVLPRLIHSLGKVDLFIHDSDHSYRNMHREFATVWPHLSPGGVVISDDVHRNPAFLELRERKPAFWQVVRQGRKSYASFGVAVR